jgi:hypothetical protein
MMPIILTIAIILVSAAALLLLVVLLTPFRFLTEFAVSSNARTGRFLLSWMHPRILGMRYDFAHDLVELTIFGRHVKTFTRAADVHEKTGKRADTGTAKKGPVAQEPAQRDAKPAAPAPSPSVKRSSSTNVNDQAASPGPTTWSRFAQFRDRMLSHGRKLRSTWRILQRHHLASGAFGWLIRLFSACFRVVRFDHVRINVRAGMEDPAELGKIYGWCTAGIAILAGNRKNVILRFEPQFMQRRLAFDGSVGLRTSAARVLMPVLVALITFPWLRAFFAWRRFKAVYKS